MTPSPQQSSTVNRRFIGDAGPIADLLIDDAKRLWRQQQWRGPTAFRHYITLNELYRRCHIVEALSVDGIDADIDIEAVPEDSRNEVHQLMLTTPCME